jgi:hypothetical protein
LKSDKLKMFVKKEEEIFEDENRDDPRRRETSSCF